MLPDWVEQVELSLVDRQVFLRLLDLVLVQDSHAQSLGIVRNTHKGEFLQCAALTETQVQLLHLRHRESSHDLGIECVVVGFYVLDQHVLLVVLHVLEVDVVLQEGKSLSLSQHLLSSLELEDTY